MQSGHERLLEQINTKIGKGFTPADNDKLVGSVER
ncbi:hypothetical protein M2387_004850 [Klebsiella sp. BIGb0407]|nr:hypothetical protein [Klebsiella sp. BIGb0407]